jgi:4a-hydroxytetrahydrobiopterin dehydratase
MASTFGALFPFNAPQAGFDDNSIGEWTMERRKLTEQETTERLDEMPGWVLVDGKMQRMFKFRSFAEAMGWMTTLAIIADKIDHHPEWSNVYNRVTVSLITHDLGAISTLDIVLAQEMEAMYEGR